MSGTRKGNYQETGKETSKKIVRERLSGKEIRFLDAKIRIRSDQIPLGVRVWTTRIPIRKIKTVSPIPVAATSETPAGRDRADLHQLIGELPPNQVETARQFLRWLIHEGRQPVPQVAPATDAEVEAAGDAFIAQYKTALERLAK